MLVDPLIVPLWPDCEVPLVLPVPVEGVLPAVLEPVPAVEPLSLGVPEVAPVLPEPLVLPAPVVLPVLLVPAAPLVGAPDEPPVIDAFVSVQLVPEPVRHPVTVTVPVLLMLLELLWSAADELALEPLVPAVPVVPLVPCVPLVDPLCAATLTAKAKARPEAVVTTRFMC
jgi:hypothetical protein